MIKMDYFYFDAAAKKLFTISSYKNMNDVYIIHYANINKFIRADYLEKLFVDKVFIEPSELHFILYDDFEYSYGRTNNRSSNARL